MKNGISDLDRIIFIKARNEAIVRAIGIASEGDIVLIAGKEHEKFEKFFFKKVYFDDLEVGVYTKLLLWSPVRV
jgi:UDP-N-acetylmuramoyl-L-alanyl-D-glutamate--2,6-diaminopimelate ligase